MFAHEKIEVYRSANCLCHQAGGDWLASERSLSEDGNERGDGIQVEGRHFEGAFFQPPIEDRKAALLIDQHLQMRARLVDKDKSVTIFLYWLSSASSSFTRLTWLTSSPEYLLFIRKKSVG